MYSRHIKDKDTCYDCGTPAGQEHDEECIAAEHADFLRGDEIAKAIHDPDECEACLLARGPVLSDCRCGKCCRELIIEVSELDARREPKIRERGSPIKGINDEPVGYLLNSKYGDHHCVFLDKNTNLCTIYSTRPLICRLFDCDKSEFCPERKSPLTVLPSE